MTDRSDGYSPEVAHLAEQAEAALIRLQRAGLRVRDGRAEVDAAAAELTHVLNRIGNLDPAAHAATLARLAAHYGVGEVKQ